MVQERLSTRLAHWSYRRSYGIWTEVMFNVFSRRGDRDSLQDREYYR